MASEPGYRVVTEKTVTGTEKYSASGPGLGPSILLLDTEEQADTLCRMLHRAFAAGEQQRSSDICALLGVRFRFLR